MRPGRRTERKKEGSGDRDNESAGHKNTQKNRYTGKWGKKKEKERDREQRDGEKKRSMGSRAVGCRN